MAFLRMSKAFRLAWFASFALTAAPAAAQTSSLDRPYAQGFAISRFEPAPAGDRFFAVPDASSSDVRLPLRAMLLGHLTLAPSLVRADNDDGQQRDIVSRQLYAHLDGSVVVARLLLLNADLPLALSQDGEGPAAPGSPAFGDVRVSVRARLLGSEHAPFSFAPAVDVWLPTGSERDLTGDGTLRVGPRVIASGRVGAFVYAANVGAQFRRYVDTGSTESGSAVSFGAAAGALLFDDVLQIGAELYGSGFVVSDHDANFASRTSPLEALFGVRGRVRDLALGAAVGPGLSDAAGVAPRLLLSVAYAPVSRYQPSAAPPPLSAPPPPVDRDSDGIPDADDACPDIAGVANDVRAEHGCPAPLPEAAAPAAPPKAPEAPAPTPSAEADVDADGIRDANDGCPREAASTAPGSPSDGCPGHGPAEASYAGYRQEGSVATVFVELTDSVKVEVEALPNGASFLLRGVRVGMKNNENPLLAMDFASNVESARLAPEKDGVRLLIQFRNPVTPTYRLIRKNRGATLEVSVPNQP